MTEPILREYAYGSGDYRKALILRDRILNIADSIRTKEIEFLFGEHPEEKEHYLLGAFDGEDLIATLNLQKQADGSLLLRQFAMHAKRQGTGIGMRLLRFAHDFARERGFSRIELHSRDNVIGFYEKAGYVRTGHVSVGPILTLIAMAIDL